MKLKDLREVGKRADNVGAVRQVKAIASGDKRRSAKDYAFYLAVGVLACVTLLFLVSILKSLVAKLG